MALHASEEVPVGWAHVALLHRTAVDRHSRSAKFKRTVEDRKEISLALCGVVEAATHLQGHRAPAAHASDHRFDNGEGILGLAQQASAAAAAKNLFEGTTEIEVDGVISRFDQIVRRFSKLLRA